MKISYRTHPALKCIESGEFDFAVESTQLDRVRKSSAAETFKNYNKAFSTVRVISSPFMEAIEKGVGKIFKAGLVDNISGSGTFCFKRQEGFWETYCCDFSMVGDEIERIIFYYLQGDRLIIYFNAVIDQAEEYVSPQALTDGIQREERVAIEMGRFIDFFAFTKYAQVETQYLPAGQKVKGIDCKYVNETKSNITILDSKWFTTLVKSDGFKVRGHFRLQPKKINGVMSKELIRIADFEKTGYTAPARKLAVHGE